MAKSFRKFTKTGWDDDEWDDFDEDERRKEKKMAKRKKKQRQRVNEKFSALDDTEDDDEG